MLKRINFSLALPIIAALFIFGCSGAGQKNNLFRANTKIDAERYDLPDRRKWDTKPVLLKGKSPVYPIGRLLSGKEGCSTISFSIGIDGKTRDFKIVNTDDEWFANHSIIAVRDWIYDPAKKDGAPVESRLSHKFCFKT